MNKVLLLLVAALPLLSACNTIQGMGEDLENAGEGISDTAKKAKDEINK